MKVNKSLADQECLPNCHEIQFTSSEYIEKLDPEEFCDESIFLYGGNSLTGKQAYEESEDKTMMLKIKHFLKDANLVQKVKIMKDSSWNDKDNITSTRIQKELCVQLVKNDLAKVTLST